MIVKGELFGRGLEGWRRGQDRVMEVNMIEVHYTYV
jgi:hypothetical protein